jgi:uncharacterized membrane protein
MSQNRWKSKVVWIGILSQVLIVIGVFVPSISDPVKIVGAAIIEGLTLFGLLNDPTNKTGF